MADRVWRLLADPLKRKERGRAARDWVVREFSTATLARKTEAVYLSILAGKKR
jgi:glycosyltransferase involved in cell wall biosynthesis